MPKTRPADWFGGVRFEQLKSYYGARPTLSSLGFAFTVCWMWSMQRSLAEHSSELFQPMMFLGLSVACVAVGLLALTFKENVTSRAAFMYPVTMLGCACTFVLHMSYMRGLPLCVEVVLGFICGFAAGAHYVAWGSYLRCLDIRQATLALFASVALDAVLKIVFPFLRGGLFAGLLFCLLPLLSALCHRSAVQSAPSPRVAEAPFTQRERSILRHYAVGVAVFGAAIGLIRTLDIGFFALGFVPNLVSHVLEFIVAVGVVVSAYRQRARMDFARMWTLVLIIIATGLVCASLSVAWLTVAAAAVLSAAQMIAAMFYFFALADVAQRVSCPADAVFGVGYPLYELPMTVCSFGVAVCPAVDTNVMAIVIVYILLLSVFLFMRNQIADREVLFGGLALSMPTEPEAFESQIACLAEQYGLSEREREVALLYAKGRSRTFISDTLNISENTARDHIAHIYKKMGIHSKQDFINAVWKRGNQ